MLERQPWHWFCTLTFRPKHEGPRGGVHPEKGDKAFRYFVSNLNRHLYGRNWHRRPHGGVVWARGQELHKDGRIHFHAVMASPDVDLNSLTRRMDWVDWWWKEYGIARIEKPESQAAVSGYVSKYVAKDGEVDFSSNFGRYVPPALEFWDVKPPGLDKRHPAPVAEGEPRTGREMRALGNVRCLTLPVCPQFLLIPRYSESTEDSETSL